MPFLLIWSRLLWEQQTSWDVASRSTQIMQAAKVSHGLWLSSFAADNVDIVKNVRQYEPRKYHAPWQHHQCRVSMCYFPLQFHRNISRDIFVTRKAFSGKNKPYQISISAEHQSQPMSCSFSWVWSMCARFNKLISNMLNLHYYIMKPFCCPALFLGQSLALFLLYSRLSEWPMFGRSPNSQALGQVCVETDWEPGLRSLQGKECHFQPDEISWYPACFFFNAHPALLSISDLDDDDDDDKTHIQLWQGVRWVPSDSKDWPRARKQVLWSIQHLDLLWLLSCCLPGTFGSIIQQYNERQISSISASKYVW